jgi:acetylornithine aminotransferase
VCAAAIATVRTILEDGILNRCEEMGEYLEGELERLQHKYPFVKEVRGIGLMIGMALDIPAGDIVRKGHERGVLLNVTHDTVLRFVPPLIVTKQEVNQMIAILDGIFAETEA